MVSVGSALVVLDMLPKAFRALEALFGLVAKTKSKQEKVLLDKLVDDFKKELQKDFALLAESVDALQVKVVSLQETVDTLQNNATNLRIIVYTLCGLMSGCIVYIALHLARIVR
jgi:hypothetical protein